jgi:hypothetical protein
VNSKGFVRCLGKGYAVLGFKSTAQGKGSLMSRNRVSTGRRVGLGPLVSSSEEVGLGTLLARITSFFGVKPCESCHRRAAMLDSRLVLVGTRASAQQSEPRSGDCWPYKGGCTGFGRRQCISAPARQEPDAETIEQCCGGWFQYPWIEVCPGSEARQGCGFCFW